MNPFDEAARKAMLSSAAFPDRFTLARKMSVNDILQTLSDEGGKSDDYLLDFAVKIEPIIAKHYAEIEAVHKKLCELAVIVPQILEMNMQMAEQLYGRDEEGGIPIPQIVSVAYSIVDDPQVKAAMERSKE